MVSLDNNNPSKSAPLPECYYRNKYENWYWKIINQCPKTRPNFHRTEEHHIVSKCFGGSKTDPDNLCYPTLRQHFVLHRLLNKMFPDHEGLWYAIFRMSFSGGGRVYEYLRKNYVRTESHNSRIADSLRGIPQTPERRSNISKARLESPNIPRGSSHPNSNKELENRKSEIRQVWNDNNKPGDILLGQLLGLGTKKNGYRSKTLQRFIKEFREEDIV